EESCRARAATGPGKGFSSVLARGSEPGSEEESEAVPLETEPTLASRECVPGCAPLLLPAGRRAGDALVAGDGDTERSPDLLGLSAGKVALREPGRGGSSKDRA